MSYQRKLPLNQVICQHNTLLWWLALRLQFSDQNNFSSTWSLKALNLGNFHTENILYLWALEYRCNSCYESVPKPKSLVLSSVRWMKPGLNAYGFFTYILQVFLLVRRLMPNNWNQITPVWWQNWTLMSDCVHLSPSRNVKSCLLLSDQ